MAVGWAVVETTRPPLPVEAQGRDPVVAAKSRPRDRPADEGGKLLARIMDRRDRQDDFRDILPAKDRAVACEEALARVAGAAGERGVIREAAARLAHFMEQDPPAAMETAVTSAIASMAGPDFLRVITAALMGQSTDTLLACLSPTAPGGAARDIVLSALAESLAAEASPTKLRESLDRIDFERDRLFPGVIRAWPRERLDSLAEIITARDDGSTLTTYLHRLGADRQREWLASLFGSDTPSDPGDAARLHLLLRQSSVPWETRVEWIGRLRPPGGAGIDHPEDRDGMLRQHVADLLSRTEQDDTGSLSDWKFRLRHQQISAAEVMADVKRALPDANQVDRDVLVRSVFTHIAAHDPPGAVGLLGEIPAAEREKLVLDTAFSSAGAGDPRALLGLVSALPPDESSIMTERFRVWVRAANPGVAAHGDSYGEWVLALPHGIERDLALSGLASHFDFENLATAAEYRAAKTLPEGWRPAGK